MPAQATFRMENGNEYEIVSHGVTKGFKIFLVNLDYRTPHIHSDFEISFLLKGSATILCEGKSIHLTAPDFFIMNPFTPHEIRTQSPALFLSIQVQTSFFKSYFPHISHVEFLFSGGKALLHNTTYETIYNTVLSMALCYFKTEPGFPLYCAAKLNELFYLFFTTLPHKTITTKEHRRQKQQYERIRRISSYIDEHFAEKLLLRDIAEQEQLSLTYLSHFFKDYFQMSFQDYILYLRCEKARQQLLLTDHNLLEICLECGFSDMKYLNKGFYKIYGIYPKELRKQSMQEIFPIQPRSLQSTQQFLSAKESRLLLDEFLYTPLA